MIYARTPRAKLSGHFLGVYGPARFTGRMEGGRKDLTNRFISLLRCGRCGVRKAFNSLKTRVDVSGRFVKQALWESGRPGSFRQLSLWINSHFRWKMKAINKSWFLCRRRPAEEWTLSLSIPHSVIRASQSLISSSICPILILFHLSHPHSPLPFVCQSVHPSLIPSNQLRPYDRLSLHYYSSAMSFLLWPLPCPVPQPFCLPNLPVLLLSSSLRLHPVVILFLLSFDPFTLHFQPSPHSPHPDDLSFISSPLVSIQTLSIHFP